MTLIEGLDHVDAALNDIVEETGERRPILKLEENSENQGLFNLHLFPFIF